MASCNEILLTLVKENSKEIFISASKILITFADNILKNPQEDKYRKIRIANPTIQNKLLNSVGGMECLFIMGFEESEDGEHLTLPKESSLQSLKLIRDGLNQELTKLQVTQQQSESSHRQRQAMQRFSNFQETETAFASRIRDGVRRVLQYEKPQAQQKALSVIPVQSLKAEAEVKLKSSEQSEKLDSKDFLLLALLKWFKFSFFKWVDTLPCAQCGGATKHNGSAQPSNDDLKWGASRVEAHLCNTCQFTTRFPRYTNAEKLLETRKGRCGEWADCFTLCCRALGFEARYVMDWTDHVWTEVYSTSRSRWLHCDPCENVCDKPLLYESGWGKKLTYVIAVSKDEVQDVSWRYSAKHNELLGRRRLCRETWLRSTIHQIWKQQIGALPGDRQMELWKRLVQELTEFITVKADDENLPGRSTGSLAWRQARGEVGNSGNSNTSDVEFTFTLTASERESELLHVVYNSSTDKYIRKSANSEEINGWRKCVFVSKDIIRKEELDWRMVYLARSEGASSAEISWKFDLTDSDLRIGKVDLKAQTAVFEDGKVSWRICCGDTCILKTGNDLQEFFTFDAKGSKTLSVTAMLTGGKGNNAWQHTQLFRQSADDTSSNPFEIVLKLN